MFERILADLSAPAPDLGYEIRSFVKKGNSDTLEPVDFVIQAERHGIPQSRHRVILLGVRKDAGASRHDLLQIQKQVSVKQAIGDLPKIRSRLSKGDSLDAWREAVLAAPSYVQGWGTESEQAMRDLMRTSAEAASWTDVGKPFPITATWVRTGTHRRPFRSRIVSGGGFNSEVQRRWLIFNEW